MFRELNRVTRYQYNLAKSKEFAERVAIHERKLIFKISHDLRTPLRSVLEYIKLLNKKENKSTSDTKILEHMTHTIQHALLLVNNLLEFHSSNLNETPVPASIPFNVYILFNDIYESFKPLTQSKGLDFYYHTPGKDNPFCNGDYVGDPVRIRQCVENLISNAINLLQKEKLNYLYVLFQNIKVIIRFLLF